MNVLKRQRLAFVALAFLFASVSVPASAQRTMEGQYFLSAEGISSVLKDRGLGFTLGFGKYFTSSRFDAGFEYLSKKGVANYSPILLYGDWMYRFASTRDHMLNVYAGGVAFIGYEAVKKTIQPAEENAASIVVQSGNGYEVPGFSLGLGPRLDAEVFIAKSVSLTLAGTLPLSFLSANEKVSFNLSVGLRVNL